MAITKFRDENFFLSNMFPFEPGIRTPDGVYVHTSEQLYLPSRLVNREDRVRVQSAVNGFAAKSVLRRVLYEGAPVRPDWGEVKVDNMRMCLAVKFRTSAELGELLLATDGEELIEGNTRKDRFWGVSPPPPHRKSQGLNMLGRLLMETRDCLKAPEQCSYATIDIDELLTRIYAMPSPGAEITPDESKHLT